jgi:hypothetical protein
MLRIAPTTGVSGRSSQYSQLPSESEMNFFQQLHFLLDTFVMLGITCQNNLKSQTTREGGTESNGSSKDGRAAS